MPRKIFSILIPVDRRTDCHSFTMCIFASKFANMLAIHTSKLVLQSPAKSDFYTYHQKYAEH